jgi:hypothetical protein
MNSLIIKVVVDATQCIQDVLMAAIGINQPHVRGIVFITNKIMEITKEIKDKIKKLKPERGIVTFFIVDEKKKETEVGKICKCGRTVIGNEYMSTSMDVHGDFREYYLLCIGCNETEYCSTISDEDSDEESYVNEDRFTNKNVSIII